MILSVALSLYLGLGVPVGIAIYWIASNLLSIAQMYLLNVAINPKKYVDYDALEKSREALEKMKAFGAEDKKSEEYKANRQREKADLKRFKHIVNKHVVFYSEKSGFYKYYKDLIAELLRRSNLSIHYITNDPNDVIFEVAKDEPRIKPYYVSLKKTATLMMLIETDMFVMTTPDLNKYYLKRSFIKSDIEYVYVPHDMMSVHMSFREGALDAFDTIFCTGPHVEREVRATEKVYGLKEKTLVHFGYPLADMLKVEGDKANAEKQDTGVKEILIAPSWQEDNLLDSCIDGIIEALYADGNHITVRPHPEYAKRFGSALDDLIQRYKDYDESKLTFELNFSANKSIYSSDVLITDWSGVATEFCFATNRPAVFVNTKMKCPNPNYTKIEHTPVEISLRNEIGVAIEKDEVHKLPEVLQNLSDNAEHYKNVIEDTHQNMIFNHGSAAKVGADYILRSLANKKTQKR
jgi:YidC/Oxa1 family membrane protein insertase